MDSGPVARRSWPALDIHRPDSAPPHALDLLLAALDDFEPTAIEEDEAAHSLRVFFASSESRDRAREALCGRFDWLSAAPAEVPDEDWAARSQADLRAVRAGRLVVAPPWDCDPAAEREGITPIVILPSMGFGTGHHASTRLCLLALQRLEWQGHWAIDVGTGSGILAIAAVRLGAARALGIDTDPDALAAARENLERNRVSDRVELLLADFRSLPPMSAPVVLANLSGASLVGAARRLLDSVEPGGYLVASGFTERDADVLPALEAQLSRVWVGREEEWLCAILQRSPSLTSHPR